MITSLKENQYKDIIGYEGLYAITRDGRVWSYPKLGKQGRWMSTHQDGSGYLFVRLQNNKTSWQPKVHRLVALHFVLNHQNNPYVNHLDGSKLNNNADNLEWVTASENIKHAFKIGLSSQLGSRNACAKLNEEKVHDIRLLHKRGIPQKEIAKKYHVSRSVINRVVKNKGWNHV